MNLIPCDRLQHEAPRWWRGHSVLWSVEVADADGHCGQADLRLLVGHSSSLAHQETTTAATAHTKEAVQVEAHGKHGTAQHSAGAADAEAAIAVYAGRARGRRPRRPRPWRYHTLR